MYSRYFWDDFFTVLHRLKSFTTFKTSSKNSSVYLMNQAQISNFILIRFKVLCLVLIVTYSVTCQIMIQQNIAAARVLEKSTIPCSSTNSRHLFSNGGFFILALYPGKIN